MNSNKIINRVTFLNTKSISLYLFPCIMILFNRILLIVLVISLIAIPGFSQETDSKKKPQSQQTKGDEPYDEPSKSSGMRKIASGSGGDLDLDINIDEETLEADI